MEQLAVNARNERFEIEVLDGIRVARDWLDLLYRIELEPDDRAAKAIEVAIRLSDQICVLGLRRHFDNDAKIAEEVSNIKLQASKIEERSINRYSLADQTPLEPEIVAKLILKYDEDSGHAIRKSWNVQTIKWRKAKLML